MRGKNLRETPDFVKGVVERRRRGADHVRLAEIALHAGCLEFFEQFLGMFMDKDGELTAALLRLARRDNSETLRTAPVPDSSRN